MFNYKPKWLEISTFQGQISLHLRFMPTILFMLAFVLELLYPRDPQKNQLKFWIIIIRIRGDRQCYKKVLKQVSILSRSRDKVGSRLKPLIKYKPA